MKLLAINNILITKQFVRIRFILQLLAMYLHKYKSFHVRERPIIVNPPPDTAVPKPSLISVSRCSTQQESTAISVKIDESEIDVSTDSHSSNDRVDSSNMQSKVLLV